MNSDSRVNVDELLDSLKRSSGAGNRNSRSQPTRDAPLNSNPSDQLDSSAQSAAFVNSVAKPFVVKAVPLQRNYSRSIVIVFCVALVAASLGSLKYWPSKTTELAVSRTVELPVIESINQTEKSNIDLAVEKIAREDAIRAFRIKAQDEANRMAVKRELAKRAAEAEAFGLLRIAATSGERTAQYEIAMAYYNGKGVQQDRREAVIWFENAAEQGSKEAQFKLGFV